MATRQSPDSDHTSNERPFKKITLNIDLVDYERMKALLPEAKAMGAVSRSTTQTDLICEGLKLRLDEVEQIMRKKRPKK